MARIINDIHKFIGELLTRKEQGQYHTPAEIDAALDAGQKELFKEYYEMKYWKALDPFKVSNFAFNTNSTGVLSFPNNYECFRMAFVGTIAAPISIRNVDEDELPDAITSQLRKISTTKPIGVLSTTAGAQTFNLYPQANYSGFLTYYMLPPTPRMAFTQTGRTLTYDAANSVQLGFTDVHVDKVIAKALGFLGVNMSEDQLVNFSQYKEKTA